MGFHNIEKRNLWYTLPKLLLVDPWHNHVFYRKIIVNNADQIPKDGHVIFTPNHQNALLDALALLCTVNRPLVFLARSDIFKKKKIASILYYLKILPVYRIRDGYSSLKNNSETFQKTIDVIQAGKGLVILPEGDYIRKHQLRPLKKGFARIAIQTEEANDFNLNLKIIPVGIHYSDYDERRGELTINYGKPISIADYYDLIKSNPAIALNKISVELSKRLRTLMIDLPEDDYDLFDDLLKMKVYDLRQHKLYTKTDLSIEKQFVENLKILKEKEPDTYTEIKEFHDKLLSMNKVFGIPGGVELSSSIKPFKFIRENLQFLFGLPFFVYGAINNMLPYLLTEYFVGKVKDVNFKNSFRFVISLLVFLFSYILQSALIISLTKIWWIGFIYFFSLPVAFNFSICYTKAFQKIKYRWQILLLKIKDPNKSAEISALRIQLLKLIQNI